MVVKSVSKNWRDERSDPALLLLSKIGCDAFERALLPIIRQLTSSCRSPNMGNWLPIYGHAEKLWGVRTGLPLVYGLSKIVVSLLRIKGDAFRILPPSDDTSNEVTADEQLLLLLIHHLRRGHVNAGCDLLLDLVDGEMDEELMEQAREFAQRHSCGQPLTHTHEGVVGSHLRLVD